MMQSIPDHRLSSQFWFKTAVESKVISDSGKIFSSLFSLGYGVTIDVTSDTSASTGPSLTFDVEVLWYQRMSPLVQVYSVYLD